MLLPKGAHNQVWNVRSLEGIGMASHAAVQHLRCQLYSIVPSASYDLCTSAASSPTFVGLQATTIEAEGCHLPQITGYAFWTW